MGYIHPTAAKTVADIIGEINGKVNNFVWGPVMIFFFVAVGIFLTVRTRFFQVSKFGLWLNSTILAVFKDHKVRKTSDKKSISQFQALSTALAATIGTGNIVGVATAIVSGGPGAVFWMWVSAFFGMMTNFSENVLGILYRHKNEKGEWIGGAMLYIEKGLKQKWLAVLFSIFCILASFGIGNMSQANSISSAMKNSFHIPTWVTGVVIAAIAALVILGGIRRIASVAEKIVPFMALAYMLGGIIIICLNIQGVPNAFRQIFESAFSLKSVGGGVMGYAIARAIRFGVARGVFSNEAGLGSSVMVHSASDVKEPVRQGMWGVFEVFVDTIIVCTITALSILCTGVLGKTDANGELLQGAALTAEAFKHGLPGDFAGAFVSLAIMLFAFSTILGWSYYGERGVEYLFGLKYTWIYKCIFIAVIVVGCTTSLDLVWEISDTFNGLMAIPNLIAVTLLSGKVVQSLMDYLARRKAGTLETTEPLKVEDMK